MNAVTKTLIVLVFALSVAFAAVQVMLYGKRENYGEAYNKAVAARDVATEKKQAAEAELKDRKILYDTEKMRLDTENARLVGEKRTADGHVQRLELLTGDMSTTIQQREARVTALEADIVTSNASIQQLKDTIAQRDEAIRGHLNKIAGLDATVAQRNATIGQLEHDLTETKRTLVVTSASEEQLLYTIAELKKRGTVIPPIALPIVNGRVVRVDNEYGVAVVDKGKNAGVKPNTTFTIYDGTEYVARLVIHDVQPQTSMGLIQLVAGRDVKEGDKATTEIP